MNFSQDDDSFSRIKRFPVIASALLALFLGALDALVMAAAMPTVVADLGGLPLYSWVYSAYFLARAVSLPIFGKLADLFETKWLFITSIAIFLVASIMAGLSTHMGFLIFSRVIQGIGAGGNFALVYIVLTDAAHPERRGKTLGLASFIWGLASLLGPTLGGLIVTYLSWRWIFFMNIPLALMSMVGLYFFLAEMREKKKKVHLDMAGVFTLTIGLLGLLTLFLTGGRIYAWMSVETSGLALATLLFFVGFYFAEKRSPEPVISLEFFRYRGFSTGNLAVFTSSFVIFCLFAYAPLYIQGVLGKSPMEVGVAMLSLSLGWSTGSLGLGQVVHRVEEKRAAIAGGVLLIIGSGATWFFTSRTAMPFYFSTFLCIGLGMGFVTLPTLLVVQASLTREDLGVATSSHQLARTLGGTVGIGIGGGLFTARLEKEISDLSLKGMSEILPAENPSMHMENLFNPEMLSKLSEPARKALEDAALSGLSPVFHMIAGVSVFCFLCCLALPKKSHKDIKKSADPPLAQKRKI